MPRSTGVTAQVWNRVRTHRACDSTCEEVGVLWWTSGEHASGPKRRFQVTGAQAVPEEAAVCVTDTVRTFLPALSCADMCRSGIRRATCLAAMRQIHGQRGGPSTARAHLSSFACCRPCLCTSPPVRIFLLDSSVGSCSYKFHFFRAPTWFLMLPSNCMCANCRCGVYTTLPRWLTATCHCSGP